MASYAQLQLTIRPDTQYATVFLEGHPVATATRRRVYENGPAWTVHGLDGVLMGQVDESVVPVRSAIRRLVWEALQPTGPLVFDREAYSYPAAATLLVALGMPGGDVRPGNPGWLLVFAGDDWVGYRLTGADLERCAREAGLVPPSKVSDDPGSLG
jgi:hypothetical protein